MNERELRDRIFANFYDQRDKAREEEAEFLRMKNNRELRRAWQRFLEKQKAKTKANTKANTRKECRP